jgi:surface carbohydrate biosynthesis protein (TIGR04326 family)
MFKNKKLIKIHWDLKKGDKDFISILEYLNSNEIEIRKTFFEIINSFSKTIFKGKQLHEYYNLDTYNAWFMSTICEKSYYKSPHLTDFIKYLALEKIIKDANPNKIIIVNANSRLNNIISHYCSSKRIRFEAENEKITRNKNTTNKVIFVIKGILFFIRYFFQNFFSHRQKKSYFSDQKTIFLCSYLINFDKNKIAENVFGSNFWGDLPERIKNNSFRINWLHLSVKNNNPDGEFKKLGVDRKNNFNSHNFISSFLTLGSWKNIILNYITLIKRINGAKFIKIFSNERHIYSLFLYDFLDSSYGPILIQNLIYIESFDTLFKHIPKQKIGLYLQENQGWELSFVNAWKKHNHGKLVSVQHSSVSFWDMRYQNPYSEKVFPFSPDFFAINGNSARRHFKDFNYPTEKVIELEALRYLKLESLYNNNKKGILILGSIVKKTTLEMLNIILPITRGINEKIYFKSHPAQSINIDNIQYPKINITDLSLDKLLKDFDTVICCSSSGAAVESFILNLKTIVFVPSGDLNKSPLKNIPNVFFVSTKKEIAKAVKSNHHYSSEKDFFFLNNDFKNWKKLLNMKN